MSPRFFLLKIIAALQNYTSVNDELISTNKRLRIREPERNA